MSGPKYNNMVEPVLASKSPALRAAVTNLLCDLESILELHHQAAVQHVKQCVAKLTQQCEHAAVGQEVASSAPMNPIVLSETSATKGQQNDACFVQRPSVASVEVQTSSCLEQHPINVQGHDPYCCHVHSQVHYHSSRRHWNQTCRGRVWQWLG